jgi:hypothetical protein
MKKYIFLCIWGIMLSLLTYPQGCNDAGLCGMGDLSGKGLSAERQYNTQLSYTFALGEQQSLISTFQLEQRFNIFKEKGQLFLQLPFTYVYGNLGHSAGLGDISAGLNFTYLQNKNSRASFIVAARIPSDASVKTIDGKGAPMVYQTSLGTYDLALGASLLYRKWQFGLGYLKPFGSNRNSFTHDEWMGNEDALKYTEMSDLARGDDAMLRVSRFFNSEKHQYNAGLLVLYRIQKDRVTVADERLDLENSDGLTINLNLGFKTVLKNKDALSITFAAPLITREVRVDGLTRTFVVMLTYAFGSKKDDGVFRIFDYGE